MYNFVLLAEASLRRNYQDLRFCPQDDREDLARSSQRSLTRLQEALPQAQYLDAGGLRAFGLPYLRELLLPRGYRRLEEAGWLLEEHSGLGAAINMDEHIVFKALGDARQADELLKGVRQLEGKALDPQHPYAQDPAYGYLSYKPVLSGSGLHLGLIMHLPMLHFLKQARSMARGFTEEGIQFKGLSLPDGRNPAKLFLLTNSGSHRLDDQAISQRVINAAQDAARKEQAQQQRALNRNGQTSLTEQVWRSYGILRYARRLTSSDFLTHWSNLRLGVQGGILPLDPQTLDGLLHYANDYAFLREGLDPKTFAFRRADEVRRTLSGGI